MAEGKIPLVRFCKVISIDDDTDARIKDIMIANSIDLVDKGHVAEMIAGLELIKYASLQNFSNKG